MSQRSALSAVLLASAALSLLWWYLLGSRPSGPGPSDVPRIEGSPPGNVATGAPPRAPVAYTDQTGYRPPDLSTATPAEMQAIHDAEARNSAAAQPPRTYKGMDGKPKAFDYNDDKAAAEEALREVRRGQLMQELSRDPKAFAIKYKLSLKEVQWIVDGDTDFPDRLLAP